MDDTIEAEHLKNNIFILVNNEKKITLKGQKRMPIKKHREMKDVVGEKGRI